jgi:hypothetical protein
MSFPVYGLGEMRESGVDRERVRAVNGLVAGTRYLVVVLDIIGSTSALKPN